MVHRKLNRTAGHRACLLRNLVTNLFENESIVTTHAKAKEAQTMAERIITRARLADPENLSVDSRQRLSNMIYKPDIILPKLLGDIRERYSSFNGGYTRVLKLENRLGDNAPQAILELVNGKRDMRMALTARVVARYETYGVKLDGTTAKNVEKICRDQPTTDRFREEVEFMKQKFYKERQLEDIPAPTEPAEAGRAPIRFVPNPLVDRK